VSKNILQPMKSIKEKDETKSTTDIELGRVTLSWDGDNNFQIQADAQASLPLCMIGDTGVVIQAEKVRWLSPIDPIPSGTSDPPPARFTGLYIGDALLHLPDIDFLPPTVRFHNCYIGTGGFTGKVSFPGELKWDDKSKTYQGDMAGELFGFQAGLTNIEIAFIQSSLVTGALAGEIYVPYLEKRIGLDLFLSMNGDFRTTFSAPKSKNPDAGVQLQSDGLLKATKEDLLEILLSSLTLEKRADLYALHISGDIRPLVFKDQINWPTFHLDDLSIDSQGHVKLPGGWLSLPSQKPLSFYGFELAITKLGFGHTDDGGKWIGFSGGIKLVEGLPMGASVEGLRITWYPDGRPIAITLNGVGVEFTIPDVLEFKGAVSYNTIPKPGGGMIHRFDGAISLNIMTINLQIDAVLVVGSDTGPEGQYNFFAIYCGVELPSGIPLGNSGVAIFGFAGLFAYQMEPNKGRHDLHPELPANEGWYDNEDGSPGWYKRDEIGVTDLKHKWDPMRDSLAFGVGATLGTMSDNGTTFHGKFLLAIVFPGPIIMLEGRGDLLKKRADATGGSKTVSEPLFRSISVLDFRLGTITLGLSAWYKYDEKGSIIDITGSAEAFFDFNNPGAWHIYIGRDEPQQYRVHAYIFKKLFEANSYFMLSKRGLKTGVWVALKLGWSYGPLTAKLEVSLDGKANVSLRPPHYYSSLLIRGSLELAVFGYGASIIVEAGANADVDDPFHILLELYGKLKLPWPLPSFEGTFKKEWGPDPVPPPLPVPLKEIAVEHLKVTTTWPLPAADGLFGPVYDRGDGYLSETPGSFTEPDHALIPTIPLDARPHLTFYRSVNDDAMAGSNIQPGNGIWERIGDPEAVPPQGPVQVRYGLKKIDLHKWVGGGSPWSIAASSTGNPKKLWGSWAAMPGNDDKAVIQTKLWLWSRNAFDITRHGGRSWSEGFVDTHPGYPCVPDAPEREICCDFSDLEPGLVLHSPWQCPDHPEITLTWSAGGDPVVTVLDQPVDGLTRALCFPGSVGVPGGQIPNDIVIGFPIGSPPREVIITPPFNDDMTQDCLYFEGRPVGPGPLEEKGITFGTDGQKGSTIDAVRNTSGLYCGQHFLVLELPRPCFQVELMLSTQDQGANPPTVEAYVPGGQTIYAQMNSLGPERLHLEGPGIVTLIVHADIKTVMHQLCVQYFPIDAEGTDAAGQHIPASISDAGVLTIQGNGLQEVHLSGGDRVCVARLCAVLPPDPAEVQRRQEMTRHFQTELARWYQEDDLLELNTIYRLTVVTTVEARGEGELADWQPTPNPLEQTQCAYFRTEGPPGLTRLSLPTGGAIETLYQTGTVSVPKNSSAVTGNGTAWKTELVGALLQFEGIPRGYRVVSIASDTQLVLSAVYDGNDLSNANYSISKYNGSLEDLQRTIEGKIVTVDQSGKVLHIDEPEQIPAGQHFVLKSALNDLTPYVRQTVPPTVPAPGQLPPLPRPVYRAYDTGVEFNENYVDLMYRLQRRGLALYLFDNNNRPARDAEGRLIVMANRWGKTEDLWLDESELLSISRVNANGCASLDPDLIRHDKTLNSLGLVLDPDTVYEARLIPLILDEDFSTGLGVWQTIDEGARNAPSKWQIRKSLTGSQAAVSGKVVTLDGTPDLSTVDLSVDVVLLESDTARTNHSYRIIAADQAKKEVTLDATPTLTGGKSSWLIPMSGVEQGSDISGGDPRDGRDPNKPGTMLLTGGSSWSDYRFGATVRSWEGGALGVVFRCQNLTHYYRFSMSRDHRYRRLVRVTGTEHRILAEEYFVYQTNRDYRITVEAVGDWLRVYVDDDLVCDVHDATFPAGGVGLYCWQDKGRFTDVRVDDLRQAAPVVYRYKFTTSRFADFFHHLHSFQDETWREPRTQAGLSPALPDALAKGSTLDKPPSDDESRAFDALLRAVLPTSADQNPAEVQVTRVDQDETPVALLVQSPEPIDWQRTILNVASAERSVPQPSVPGAAKLTGVRFGASQPDEESVDLLLREPLDPSGYRIEYRHFPSAAPEPADPEILMADSFTERPAGLLFDEAFGPNALDLYEIIAEEPPSGGIPASEAPDWKVANNRIEQSGLYRGGTPAGDPLPARPGTIALSKAGPWSNVRIRVTLHSASWHDIGLVFRGQDKDNYYRFSVSRFDNTPISPFRRLVKKINGAVQVLWQDDHIARTDRPCHLVIDTFGDHLIGYLDDELLFSLHDPSFANGRVGFYCWNNGQAFFEGLQIETLEADPVLWQPPFQDVGEVTLVEEPHSADGQQADWQVQSGALVQLAEVAALEGELEGLPGAARDIAISPDGDVYILGVDGMPGGDFIYHWNGAAWHVSGGPAVRIAPGNFDDVLFITDLGEVFLSTSPGGPLQTPSPATDIAIGSDGALWLVGSDPVQGGYNVYRGDGVAWVKMGIGALRVAVGPDGRAWVVTDAGLIYVYDDLNKWQQIPGSANDIVVGADGSVWLVGDTPIGADFAIYRWDGAGWEAMFGPAVAIAVAPDGQPWLVDSAGTISRWHGSPLHQPGTYVVGGDPLWQDVCISAKLGSDSDGAIGVMFRYQDAGNYYRFAMDRKTGFRRLVKRVNGEMTELWKEAWSYQRNRSYELTLQAVGSELRGYLVGELLFTVYDGDLRQGQVGLYCHANDGAYFERLVVEDKTRRVGRWTIHDDGDQDAPSVWRQGGGALTQTSTIHGGTPDAPGTYALAGESSWTDLRLTVHLRSDDPGAIGVIFRYVDADNYYRFSMDQTNGYRRLIKKTAGIVTVLWEDTAQSYIVGEVYTLAAEAHAAELAVYLDDVRLCTVNDGSHSAGRVGLYCATNAGARFEDVEVSAYPTGQTFNGWLLDEPFDELVAGRWVFEDWGDWQGPSDWSVNPGELRQASNISFQPWHPVLDPDQPATLAVAGESGWADYRLSVGLGFYSAVLGGSKSDIGIVFRYQDAENYYYFAMNYRSGLRRLVRKKADTVTVLWQQNVVSKLGRVYHLDIDCLGQNLRGYLDGNLLFDVADDGIAAGRIGLACSGNPGAFFTQVIVVPPVWRLFYTFREEKRQPAGTRLRVFSGDRSNAPADEAGIAYRFAAAPGQFSRLHFASDGVDLRLRGPDGRVEHLRRFMDAKDYTSIVAQEWRTLRKADGTGFFLLKLDLSATPHTVSPLPEAQYRLDLTYKRDNRAADPDSQVLSEAGGKANEQVTLDVPWQPRNV
jgi:hypothetical protein